MLGLMVFGMLILLELFSTSFHEGMIFVKGAIDRYGFIYVLPHFILCRVICGQSYPKRVHVDSI